MKWVDINKRQEGFCNDGDHTSSAGMKIKLLCSMGLQKYNVFLIDIRLGLSS